MKKLIIFVCNGNIHRSVIAAEILRKMLRERKADRNFSVDSYGLQGTKGTELPKHKHLSDYPKEWKAAKPTLQEFGIDIKKHSFQKITTAAMKKVSVVIAMDDKVHSEAKNSLMKQFPNQGYKIHRFSELTPRYRPLKDPAGSGDEKVHRDVIKTIHSTLSKKFEDILAWAK